MELTNQPIRILTFDIEDWFHLLNYSPSESIQNWNQYECRIHQNTERILHFLSDNQQKASFFILGWIAEKYPQIVKKIINQGHEIGLHSYAHQLYYMQTKSEFKYDLQRSVDLLSNLYGNPIYLHRAAGFSINKQNLWVFEELANQKITVDSSVFPARHTMNTFREFPFTKPCIIKNHHFKLKELPINVAKYAGLRFVFSGGGFFRCFPYPLISKFTKQSDYIMSYFHPRDFDIDKKNLKYLSIKRRFISSYGTNSCLDKLQQWISKNHFTDIHTALKQIDWEKTEKDGTFKIL